MPPKGSLAPLTRAAVAAALCASLAGCGGTGTPSSNSQLSPAALSHVKQVTNFGASITCGYYAKQQGTSGNVYSQLGYAGRFDASLGVPAKNLCKFGDQAADTVRTWVMPNTVPTLGSGQLFTVMIGTNDAQACGLAAPCVTNWRKSLTAALTWLALPSTDKILGSSLSSLSSAWSPDLEFGVATSAPSASLSFPVTQTVSGRTLYLAYRVFDPGTIAGGHAAVQLDNVYVADLHTIVDTGRSIHTTNGLTDTIFVAAIPLGGAGKHIISITNSASGGFFSFQWAGVSSDSYSAVPAAPRVLAAALPSTSSATLNTALLAYNSALADMVTALAADGMYITFVPCDTALDANKDLYDTVHPNDAGHQKLASAFGSVF